MLVVGIDVGAEVHQVAVVDESDAVVTKPTAFEETAAGYEKLFGLLVRAGARGGEDLPLATASAPPPSTLVVMEATGHYWQNLFAALVAKGFAVALVNPLRTHRFAGEELARTKPIASTVYRSPDSARRSVLLQASCRRRQRRNCAS
jgi:transposase